MDFYGFLEGFQRFLSFGWFWEGLGVKHACSDQGNDDHEKSAATKTIKSTFYFCEVAETEPMQTGVSQPMQMGMASLCKQEQLPMQTGAVLPMQTKVT